MTDFEIHNTDCITGMAEFVSPDSIHLTVTSIPFGSLFTYSNKPEDVGNNADGTDLRAGQFGLHMRFFVEQLLRVMRPGCVVCIHIQQLLTTKVQHGYMGRRDFRGAVVDLFSAGGFDWTGEFVIAKDPQAIAKRQQLHSLLFLTGETNGRALAPAINDYVMLFRKPGEAPPVRCLRSLPYRPNNPDGWLTREDWIRDACGVWTDIRETDVLEGWQGVREQDDEKHICPLQLSVIRRLIRLYSNPGDLVLDPFMGIGSTAWVAIEQRRRVVGFEIKASYHRQAVRNAALAVEMRPVVGLPRKDLFSLAGVEVEAPPGVTLSRADLFSPVGVAVESLKQEGDESWQEDIAGGR